MTKNLHIQLGECAKIKGRNGWLHASGHVAGNEFEILRLAGSSPQLGVNFEQAKCDRGVVEATQAAGIVDLCLDD